MCRRLTQAEMKSPRAPCLRRFGTTPKGDSTVTSSANDCIVDRGWRERRGSVRDCGERFIGHARDTARRGHRRYTAAATTADLGIWSFVLHGVGRRGWISCALPTGNTGSSKRGARICRCTWFFFCAIHDRTLNSHVFRYQFCTPPNEIHGPDVLIASLSQLGCLVIFLFLDMSNANWLFKLTGLETYRHTHHLGCQNSPMMTVLLNRNGSTKEVAWACHLQPPRMPHTPRAPPSQHHFVVFREGTCNEGPTKRSLSSVANSPSSRRSSIVCRLFRTTFRNMAASPLDVFWDRFRKPKLINTMPDKSSGEKVARAREVEPSEPKETPPAASEVAEEMVRRWEDEFDVWFKAAHERDSAKPINLYHPQGQRRNAKTT